MTNNDSDLKARDNTNNGRWSGFRLPLFVYHAGAVSVLVLYFFSPQRNDLY